MQPLTITTDDVGPVLDAYRDDRLPIAGPQLVQQEGEPAPPRLPYRRDQHNLMTWLRDAAGGWPGPDAAGGTRAEREVETEKVRSGPRGVVLPWFAPYIDEHTGETEGMRLAYRRMWADPTVKAALLGKILSVCALDLNVIPADARGKGLRRVSKKNRDRRHEEVAEFVRWSLNERVQGCLPELAWAVLSGGLTDGYSICEKVIRHEDRGFYRGKYVLSALKPKDTGNDCILMVDDYKNVVGVQALRYSGGEVYPPANFVIFRHLSFYGSPSGLSDLRAAYGRWWMLDTVQKLRAMGLEKRALPMLYGEYETTAQKPSLEAALALARSQTWLSVPKGVRVEALNIAGGADGMFASAIADLKEDIFLAIQGATLQALTGQEGTMRGNSQVHKSTSDLFRWHLARCLEVLLNDADEGLIRDIVDLNFVVDDYPRAVLGAVDTGDLQAEAQLDAALQALGLKLSKSEMYEKYSRTPPDDDDPDDALEPAGGGGGGGGGQPGGPGGPGKPPAPPGGAQPPAFHDSYDEEFEQKHSRGSGGKFGKKAAAVKAEHEAGKAKIREEYHAEKGKIQAEHKQKAAALHETHKQKVAAEKEKGKKELAKLVARQKKLQGKLDKLDGELEVSRAAARLVNQEMRKAHAATGNDYVHDAMPWVGTDKDRDDDPASDAIDFLEGGIASVEADPLDDDPREESDYAPGELEAERAKRAEAKKILGGLLARVRKAAAIEEKTADHQEKIDELADQIGELDDRRAEVVDEVNEKIGGHKDRLDEAHEKLKDKRADAHEEVRVRHADRSHEHTQKAQEKLEGVRGERNDRAGAAWEAVRDDAGVFLDPDKHNAPGDFHGADAPDHVREAQDAHDELKAAVEGNDPEEIERAAAAYEEVAARVLGQLEPDDGGEQDSVAAVLTTGREAARNLARAARKVRRMGVKDIGDVYQYAEAGDLRPDTFAERWDAGRHWIKVTSSNVEAVRYDSVEEILHVEFHGGDRYAYSHVSPAEAAGLLAASSKGTWIWDNVRVRGEGNARKTRKPFGKFADAFADWDEEKHPRKGGKFARKGEGGSSGGGDDHEPETPEPAPERQPEGEPETPADDWAAATASSMPAAEHFVKSARARDEARASLFRRAFSFLGEAYGRLRDGVIAAGSAAFNALPQGFQRTLSAVGEWAGGVASTVGHKLLQVASKAAAAYHWLDHNVLAAPGRLVQRMAVQAAKEKGLSDGDAEKLGKVLQTTDSVFAWGVNIPLAHELLHGLAHVGGWAGFGLAKLGYFIPVASLLYCAYATATNPLATLRAAKKVIAGKDGRASGEKETARKKGRRATAHAEWEEGKHPRAEDGRFGGGDTSRRLNSNLRVRELLKDEAIRAAKSPEEIEAIIVGDGIEHEVTHDAIEGAKEAFKALKREAKKRADKEGEVDGVWWEDWPYEQFSKRYPVSAVARLLYEKLHGDEYTAHAEADGPLVGKELAGTLAARWKAAGKRADWWQALYAAALDATHDARQAVAAADASFEQAPPDVEPEECLDLLDYAPPGASDAADEHADGGVVDTFTRGRKPRPFRRPRA